MSMRFFFAAVVLVCIATIGGVIFLLPQHPAQGDDLIARGRYLVTSAGQCGDCHGANLKGQLLDFLKPKMPGIQYHTADLPDSSSYRQLRP
jgi:mono/diheme cytochrome c family protein